MLLHSGLLNLTQNLIPNFHVWKMLQQWGCGLEHAHLSPNVQTYVTCFVFSNKLVISFIEAWATKYTKIRGSFWNYRIYVKYWMILLSLVMLFCICVTRINSCCPCIRGSNLHARACMINCMQMTQEWKKHSFPVTSVKIGWNKVAELWPII